MNSKQAVWLVLMLATFAMLSCTSKPQWTTARVDNFVRQEIPAGTSKAQVIHFFDSRRIECGEDANGVHAIFRNSTGNNVRVDFRFDQNGKLVSYSVTEVPTGA